MKKQIILLFIISILLLSCNKDKRTINLSFPVNTDYEFIGVVHYQNEPYFGFAKTRFTPHVKIFNQYGILKDSISLKAAEEKLSTITGLWLNSVDSICAYSNYNGTLIILDNYGNPIFEKCYYNIIDTHSHNYDLLPSHPLYPYTENPKKDVNFPTWMWSGNSNKLPQERLDDVRNGFLFCKINPYFTENSEEDSDYKFFFQFSEIKELSNISAKSMFFAPFYNAFIVNDRTVISSFYSRYIYLMSKDLSVEKTFKLIDNTHPIVKPIPMKKRGNVQDKADETMKDCLNATFVANILYNCVKENYVFILKNGEMLSNDWDHFPFKIEIYNHNFKKIKEIEINSSNYLPRKSFILSGKLYIEKGNKSTNNKKVYELIKI